MPLTKDGRWVPNLSPKQFEVFNCFKRYILVSGPRQSGKTIGVIHRIIRHMWEHPNARVAIVSRTKASAKEGGVWDDFNKIVLPEWIEADIGLEYTTKTRDGGPGPRTIGDTRTPHFAIRNMHGGISDAMLFSLDVDREVEDRLKQKRFSCIYFPELSSFRDRKVFTISMQQLRVPPREQQMWIADCNPAEEGEEHFAFKLWFKERTQKDHPDPVFQSDLALIQIFMDDNPFLSQEQKGEIKAAHRSNPEMWDRMVLGLWTASSTEGFFKDVFRQAIHVLGDTDAPNELDWSVILPPADTKELFSGWDLGFKNHSIHIVQKRQTKDWCEFDVLDEIVSIDESTEDGDRVALSDMTERFIERARFWEKMIGKGVKWTNWADSSALDQFKPYAGGTYDALEVLKVSKELGFEVELQAAPKFAGSVQQRVDRVYKLLAENRLFVSARCFRTIPMLRKLRRSLSGAKLIAKTEAGHEHVFDSLSYVLIPESNRDALDQSQAEVGRTLRITQIRL